VARLNTPQRLGWSLFTLKNRSLFAQSLSAQIYCGLLIAIACLTLSSCHSADYYYYKFPQYTFANRPVPPSKLAQRVMIAYTVNGSSTSTTNAIGNIAIVDAKRDIRSNIENTVATFQIAGYNAGYPSMIFNFPAEVHGYVYSNTDGSLATIDYSKESSSGSAGKFPQAASIAIPQTFTHFYAAEEGSGQLAVIDNTTGSTYGLNLPDVYKVAVNSGDTVVLAMVRNSNIIYRLVKLNASQFPTSAAAIAATGATDCEPLNLPVYCVVPVNPAGAGGGGSNAFDRPVGAYFSLDGTTAYILNCGPECGGTTASLTLLNQSTLNVNTIPKTTPDNSAFVSNVPIPGGATVALSDATTLYVAGQQQMPDGLFAGYLTTVNLAAAANSPSTAVTGKYSISDGTHTKLLFADDNTLWIGSQYCATGERQKLNENYNCLTRFDRGAKTAQIVPNVVPGDSTHTVGYPNTNQNLYYYGDLTGLCWVQNFHKMYTAYGGQVHVFKTTDGSEIDNQFVTVQGTALDVAYMDAITDSDN
jgi:hypothetical protein